MKKTLTNIIAALACIAGLVIGSVGHGLLALLGGLFLLYIGAVTLINQNTDWIWNAEPTTRPGS